MLNHPPLAILAEARARYCPKLSPSRTTYFVPLAEGFFMTVKQQGAPLQVKAHLATLYYAPGQSILSSILHTRPLLTTFTPPFMFHSSDDAIAGITTTLIEIATDYI